MTYKLDNQCAILESIALFKLRIGIKETVMAKSFSRRAAYVACCALALALIVAATLIGIHRMDGAVDAHMREMTMDASATASRYICTYFDSLMRMNDGLGAFAAREDDMLSEHTALALADAVGQLPAIKITVVRADGEYITDGGARGTGPAASDLLGGRSDLISYEDGIIRVSTAITRDGESVGAITSEYSAGTLAGALNVNVLGTDGCFAVFKPDGEYVLRSAGARRYTGDDGIYSPGDFEYMRGYSADRFKSDIKAGRNGEVEYASDSGTQLYGYYMLLGINDWYIICLAPQSGLSSHTAVNRYIIVIMSIAIMVIVCLLIMTLTSMFNSRMREMRRYAGNIEDVMHKQRRALSTLGGPAFEFDMRALAARPIREDEQADRWLLDRILIPECVSEIVDPRDEAAYLKLCDALLSARGKVSGDLRLRREPGAPARMYRLTLSEPEYSGDNMAAIATLVDIDDVAQRMDALRQRAACDEVTGLCTASELRIKAGRLLNRPNHHFGTLAFIRSDNQDAVCDACPGLTQDELMRMCAGLVREAFGECDVFARGAGDEFWVFSGDQTGVEIIQKGMNKIMDSALGGGDVHLTFSCGIAHADPDDDMDSLIKRAYSAAQMAHRDGGRRLQHG